MPLDAFLKFEGEPIDGESRQKDHEKQLELESFSFGASNSGTMHTATGGGKGKGDVHDMSFSMYVDKASTKMFQDCASGQHHNRAILATRKAGGEQQEYFKVTMEDVIISSFQIGASSGSDRPMANFSLNFAKIYYEYAPQKPDGTLDPSAGNGWNVAEGAEWTA